jgi:sugar phosphate isomerase/epimerase
VTVEAPFDVAQRDDGPTEVFVRTGTGGAHGRRGLGGRPRRLRTRSVRTAADYGVLLDGLPDGVGFTPDLGHLVRGGMDPLDVLATYRDRIDHIHYKDVADDGSWAPTGGGVVDFPAVTRYLARTGYTGWIVMEDESPQARADPDGAAARNAEYARTVLARELT